MPDSSGEPAPPSHEQPGNSRPGAPGAAPSHVAPAPRVHPSTAQHAKSSPKVPPPPPGSRAVLEWLREYGNLELNPDGPSSTTADEDPRASQLRLPKEHRKFHRFDPDHPQPASASSAVGGGASSHGGISNDPMGGDLPQDDHLRGITAEQLAHFRQLHDNPAERWLWIALGVMVVAFLAMTWAFLANRVAPAKPTADSHDSAAVLRPPADPAGAAALPPGVLDQIDQAMIAEQRANYPRAIQLFEQAQHDAGHIYGLDYHLASLCYEANEMMQVLPLLERSIAEREEVGACYNLRGTLLDQSDGPQQGPGDLEKATLLEPLNARFFFAWGEALRRAGKPELALPQLQRAVERVREPALAGLYALKLRLTQIELEQGDVLKGEMAEKLKEIPPPGEWLLTSAALEMQGGDYSAAAQALDKLRTQAGDREMARQLRDVFFKRFTRQPELSRFFDVPAVP